MTIALNGFFMGLSLIIAIGPQNALVIRQGLRRTGLVAVIAVCLISDVFLIFGGTAGVGVIIERAPIVLTILKWGGVAYLLYFAATCFRDAVRPKDQSLTAAEPSAPSPHEDGGAPATHAVSTLQRTAVTTPLRQRSWVAPAVTAIALTWLNPAAYIDAVIMLGGLANQHGPDGRWLFAAGAMLASIVWFPTLGFGAHQLAGPLSTPRTWQIINAIIGVIMVLIAVRLALH